MDFDGINRFLDNPLQRLMDRWHLFGGAEDVFSNKGTGSQFFFEPYSYQKKPLLGLTTIITAPIAFSIFSIELILATVYFLFKALLDLATLHPLQAGNDLIQAGISLAFTGLMLLATAVSAFINLIDFLGSTVITLGNLCSNDNSDKSSIKP